MKILGIETSCDETAAAVVEDGVKILSNVIASQVELHKETGGVVPEVAARQHIISMIPVIEKALLDAQTDLPDIDAIAVTKGPGLISALIVGTQTASTLSLALNKPLIPVHHILGHIYGNWIETDKNTTPKFPVLVLTVSGGHNDILYLEDHDKIKLVGETLDDAAGEAFDKVAKLLGLGYPGGPAIQNFVGDEFCSSDCEKNIKIDFPKANLPKDSFNFSFSGLKTAVLYEIQKNFGNDFNPDDLPERFIKDIAASFQFRAVNTLLETLFRAAEIYKPKEIHIAGGVSANKLLRNFVNKKASDSNLTIRIPKDITLCTDNAAIIASRAFFQYSIDDEKYSNWRNVQPESNLKLNENS